MSASSDYSRAPLEPAAAVPGGQDRAPEITRTGKTMIWMSLLALMFGSQFAINIGEFPASIDFFCYLAFAGLLLLSGTAAISFSRLALFVLVAVVAVIGLKTGSDLVSANSMMLLLVIYLPFVIRPLVDHGGFELHTYIVRVFILLAAVLAVIGCAQLVAVNSFGMHDLANISLNLPDSVLAAGRYASTREAEGGIVKANGFFLKEASSLSGTTALAFVAEYFSRARWFVLLILLAGLLASVSGSGLLVLLAAFAVPTSRRSRIALIAALVLAAVIAASSMDMPWLNLWLDRMQEFEVEGSSGYARFVAPTDMVQHTFEAGGFTMWLGNGPGTYLRTVIALGFPYEINDPTWAKLIFEYGIFGLVLMTALFASRLYSGLLCWEMCMAVLWAWMGSGSVLKPDFALLVWLLTLVPSRTNALQLAINFAPSSSLSARAAHSAR